jgi:hypothetical protein
MDAELELCDVLPTLITSLARDVRARGIERYGIQVAAAEEVSWAGIDITSGSINRHQMRSLGPKTVDCGEEGTPDDHYEADPYRHAMVLIVVSLRTGASADLMPVGELDLGRAGRCPGCLFVGA